MSSGLFENDMPKKILISTTLLMFLEKGGKNVRMNA
jgi:hypothetical protein